MGAFNGGKSNLPSLLVLSVTFWGCHSLISLSIFFLFLFLQGLRLLRCVSSLCEEAQWLEAEAQHLETKGLEKLEMAVAGSEVEGFYRLLRGAMLHSSVSSAQPPPKKVCHSPSATISHLPPQESQKPKASGPTKQALESTSVTAPSVPEGEILANMQPLCIQLRALREFIDIRLRVAGRAHQPLMPPFVHTCEECTW